MEKVVTINLNGNPYQLDESAYAAVSSYLARTAEALKNNPDRDEIIADIEQAIADKCSNFVGPGKAVISNAEMARALEEMGEVEDDTPRSADEPAGEARTESASSSSSSSQGDEKRAKRIYRVPSGAMIAGVCNGIAAYFNIDPAIVRILFIVAAIITHGLAVLAYLILMFVIPAPHTPEEWAAAHNAPFNAQEVIDRAKREYNDFSASGGFNNWSGWYGPKYARRAARRANRSARRAARSAARASARAAAAGAWAGSRDWTQNGYTPPTTPTGAIARSFAGLFAFIFGIVSAALTIAFLITIISLIATGAVLGWIPPGGMPIWAIVLIIVIIFFTIGGPISAFRRAAYGVMNGRPTAMYHTFDGFVWIGMLGLGAWLAYLYVPPAHAWMDHAQIWLNQAWDSLQRSWEAGTAMPPSSQPAPALPSPASPGTPP